MIASILIENGEHKEGWVCDWLPVKKLIKYDRLVMTHEILNGKCPETLQINLPRYPRYQAFQPEIAKTCNYPSLD